ncbi:hypothetical protein ABZ863_17945 [Saccharomonospora sp. NPDC046836]|uniref:hypothetical protein n=1 Tax=Saccharomonospora sp. NPDC046836 TaxID=3156921 RepID=UPI0033FBA755
MKLLVFSNARDGRDDEYNEWYNKVHLPDLLTIPGVRSGARYRVHAPDAAVPEHRYLAIYDLDGDGDAVLKEIATRSGSGQFQLTDSLDSRTVKLAIWEAM